MRHIVVVAEDIKSISLQILERMLVALNVYGYRYSIQQSFPHIRELSSEQLFIFLRCAYPKNLPLIELLIQKKIPYLYYIDDDFWSIDFYTNNFILMETLNKIVSNAKGVIVHSELLAAQVKKNMGKAFILPSYYDFTLIDKVDQEFHPHELRIGYASQKSDDFEFIIPVVEQLLKRYDKKIYFEIFCNVPNNLRLHKGVRFHDPIKDYKVYSKHQFFRNWDIGLAPLLPTTARFAKTNNKYREYGACGISGVYSNIAPYSNFVKSGKTGILVEHNHNAWYEAIIGLIEDPILRGSIGQNARYDIYHNHSLDAVLPQWVNFFNSIFPSETIETKNYSLDNIPRIKYKLLNTACYILMVYNYLLFLLRKKPILQVPYYVVAAGIRQIKRWNNNRYDCVDVLEKQKYFSYR